MKKVLLVEDDQNIVELLEIHLKDLECELITATNGLDGLDLGLKQKFDLIILDIMLPQMDGVEVCRQLRAV
ncbi:MAG: response regulator, partial [Cyclobacteriaceae bacterium]